MANSDWDIDLRDGLVGESLVITLLADKQLEVKTDREWKRTGNVYIETDCYYQSSNSWKKSGINVTKSTHYAFVLEGAVFIIPTNILIQAVRLYGEKTYCKKEPNPSRGYLIRPEFILKVLK